MANIDKIFDKLISLEFNSPANALHYNDNEKGYTFFGIYEFAHPSWNGWNKVKAEIANSGSMAKASSKLYYDGVLLEVVKEFYKKEFWDKMRLGEIKHQEVANELMVMAVNGGIPRAVKLAQKLIGVTTDGVIGIKTIEALNKMDETFFDSEYDKLEIEFYEGLVKEKPTFVKYLNGWKNRATAV